MAEGLTANQNIAQMHEEPYLTDLKSPMETVTHQPARKQEHVIARKSQFVVRSRARPSMQVLGSLEVFACELHKSHDKKSI